MVDIIHRLWGNVYDTEEVKDQKLKIKMTDSTVIASSPSTKGDVAISVPSPVILRERLRINSATEESRWWEEMRYILRQAQNERRENSE
jgi:hypothetical protein